MDWDADRYRADVGARRGFADASEMKLLTKYSPIRGVEDVLQREKNNEPLPLSPHPCVVEDCHGRVLLWSLPGVVSRRHQVATFVFEDLVRSHTFARTYSSGFTQIISDLCAQSPVSQMAAQMTSSLARSPLGAADRSTFVRVVNTALVSCRYPLDGINKDTWYDIEISSE